MRTPTIAIFDIGKTNKKVFLFDEDYKIRVEKSVQLPEITDEDGFPCEDIHVLTQWVKDSLRELFSLSEYQIKAINVSAHGASFVHIDEKGNPVAPLYNYLKPYPDELKRKFYDTYGGENEFSRITASPVLGNLNSGMQLYWLKYERPEIFKRIKYSLHLPEYISYLFSGKPVSGITSIGCHTNLWDFTKNSYHDWVQKERIQEKLAPIVSSKEVNPTSLNHKEVNVGVGLHDSSAALIPYLSCFSEPFVLLSTGTWCISLNPFNQTPLTEEELKKDCLCYLTYEGKPVKASRLFTGFEHEKEVKRLAEYFHTSVDYYKGISYQPEWAKHHDSYQAENLSLYSSYEEAYTQFINRLVRQQVTSTNLVLHNSRVTRIFVDGGFSNNPIFMNLLSLAFPSIEVYAASVAQASATGAAMAIHRHWNKHLHKADMIDLKFFSSKESTT
ncbi:MAG TPA: FGGY family carbohydrate kinase [Cyclobacteriaceae bacterium]|nr:FGGY family carbohydrate kinase [Cyclobacteriaceae bacterium]HPW63744.1 FGGY family carbohydrate kinase [Cyclobacteriaceae bacterium]